MAEIRTHDSEGGSDLGRLVREALGETIRPIIPGAVSSPSVAEDDDVESGDSPSLTGLPDIVGLDIGLSSPGVHDNNPIV